ncbi:VOC family protein [Streptomyces sp. GbtcB7]|uniref:VOC family protein n=1 Tax=Streptomyces sp. GbtcB7 TaxID=2824752 RepID=UPI0034D4FB81
MSSDPVRAGAGGRDRAGRDCPVGICFMPVTDRKVVKNRLHLDLTSMAEDREAEIERILALGAVVDRAGRSGGERVLRSPSEGHPHRIVLGVDQTATGTPAAQCLEGAVPGRWPEHVRRARAAGGGGGGASAATLGTTGGTEDPTFAVTAGSLPPA